MSDESLSALFYKIGGALPQDVPSYVRRASDDELYKALRAREFCYVLNSRQMGKSSLMVRTLTRLKAKGWAGVILDFSAKDSQSDQPDLWYAGIINQLNRELALLDRPTFRQWLKDRDFIAPVERLGEFIETVLLPGTDRPIVILIDEIDSTITLPFTDDFFALIRACYNKRADNPDYQRLTLTLFGVAMPSELIGDVKRTPFNIGKAIDLKGFEFEEALPLAAGLAENADRPPVVLQEILHWTGGQPFLTQRLCQLVADADVAIAEGSEATQVEGLVRSRLIEHWESQDHQEHLKTIRKRLLNNEQKAGYLLELYRQIRQTGSVPAQNRPEERELQLAGLVVKRDGQLQVYNPIYDAVFDDAWIDAELKKLRPYSESFRAWMVSGKTDSSRLLRGEALTEAEQWAAERTPSAEDREFLSASRIQQQEETIAEKEREAELAQEKAAREAAEAAEQIQAEANRQAQQKIRRGSLVLGGALVAALVLGGLALFSGNQFRAARQQRDEAQAQAQEAKDELTEIEAQKEQIDQELSQAQQQVKTTREERDQANAELARSQENLQSLEAQRQAVDEQLKQAQQAAQGQQALLTQLEQDLTNADAAVDQAKQAEQEAQQQADQAQADLAQAEENLGTINAHIETVNELDSLIGELYGYNKSEDEGKPEAAEDAISHIGLSFTDFTSDSSELKQALLNSSIALAHLHLIPFPSDDSNVEAQERLNKAQTPVEKSINLIEKNPNVFNSSESGRAIAFFTYAVHGNLQEEQDYLREEQAPTSAYQSYEQAFRYISETTLNLRQLLHPSSSEQLLPPISPEQLLAYSFEEPAGDQFRALFTAALKKHYDFRARQLIRELETILTQYQWQEADGLTYDALLASAYSRNLDFSPFNIACSSLREIDTLWFEHSAGRFGFGVQQDIYEATGNNPGQYNVTSWIRFLMEVGWVRTHGNDEGISDAFNDQMEWLSYNELSWLEGMDGSELATSETPPGYLPWGLKVAGYLDGWVGTNGVWWRETSSRVANCGI